MIIILLLGSVKYICNYKNQNPLPPFFLIFENYVWNKMNSYLPGKENAMIKCAPSRKVITWCSVLLSTYL